MRLNSFIYVLLLIWLFSSCLVTKKYKQPELDLNETYRGMSLAEETSLAEMSWESFFDDEALKALIHEALNGNFNLLMAYQQILAAEASFKQGRAEYFPSINPNISIEETRMSNLSAFGQLGMGQFTQYSLNGSFAWEPDLWGRITANKNAVKASMEQAQEDLKAIQTALIANLATTYFQLLKADAQIELIKMTVANRKESLMVMEELKTSGRVTEAGVMQTKAQLHATEALLVDYGKMQQLLENTINVLLGREFQSIPRSQLQKIKMEHPIHTGVPALLLANRPDVRSAEFSLKGAFELTNVARANLYPNISINAGAGLQSLSSSTWLSTDAFLWNAAGNITQPLFNRRRNRTALEIAKAQQEQALLNFRKSLVEASTQVSDALINYEATLTKSAVKKEELGALHLAVSYSEDLLASGFGTYLEVLVARDSELAVEINVLDIEAERLSALVDLYRALGGGWRF
ncbi:TolC family protein [Aureibacter tunicatorum]|uniref:NodT family efflux transporter outer membrane factor (OMF) lipoprotein n=1 Tax=Aureibacter tunicatorum TaxID=866807 RepID=A0AAE3XSH1_9BACT|nr:TolC family protein [Aureibacter tunicatorum]MDR6241170.1 NodT family efflux transporter outer membrane factor (OMF) lipoprotein [Aureibacter tunicatorum]BDD03945.1 multidrug transporter [Aureibacter tunicatorum]